MIEIVGPMDIVIDLSFLFEPLQPMSSSRSFVSKKRKQPEGDLPVTSKSKEEHLKILEAKIQAAELMLELRSKTVEAQQKKIKAQQRKIDGLERVEEELKRRVESAKCVLESHENMIVHCGLCFLPNTSCCPQCMHPFCLKCVDQMLNMKTTECPVCAVPFPTDYLKMVHTKGTYHRNSYEFADHVVGRLA